MITIYRMMKPSKLFILHFSLFIIATLSSCVNEAEYENTTNGNFEALWTIMDQHYCFFTEKEQTLGVNWDEVHTRYAKQTKEKLSSTELFEVLGNMLGELRDGHVNMTSSFDYARNWSWHEDYPTNFSDTLQRIYLGTDYRMVSGLKYRILDDNIGYIRCASFDSTFGDGNLDNIMYFLTPCNGLIIDIRSNGGGQLTSAEKLASRFTNEEKLTGYMQHKTGTGHNDFSGLEERRIIPANGIRWQKGVAVLTNRSVYSAANEFTNEMRACGATIIGDHTGGGGGMPFSSELPNGWSIRFSACPMFDVNKKSIESGIDPDFNVQQTDEDFSRGKDTIIEFAREYLYKKM